MSSCTTTTTTTCYPCSQGDFSCDCPHGTVDASCVQYTGEDLDNIDADNGDFLDEILEKLDAYTFSETDFDANSTDSIVVVDGGTNGHSPSFTVRIDPDDDNAITVSGLGLLVDINDTGDGKVKVDSDDDKDYLEDQLEEATDDKGIITLTPTNLGGIIYVIPTINIVKLIEYIRDHHLELLCEIVDDCIPTTTTTTTTSTSTTTTTSTSTTTTTTTTLPPNDFQLINESGEDSSIPTVHFTDQDTLIDYVLDTTTGNGQTSSYTYNGSENDSKVTIIRSGVGLLGILITEDGVTIYDEIDTVGSVTIEDIAPNSDVVVTLYPGVGTTTTSTTTTSTTTACPDCNFVVNNNNTSLSITNIEINGVALDISPASYPIGPSDSVIGTTSIFGSTTVTIYTNTHDSGDFTVEGTDNVELVTSMDGSTSYVFESVATECNGIAVITTEDCNCSAYTIENNTVSDITVEWIECDGTPNSEIVNPSNTMNLCTCRPEYINPDGGTLTSDGSCL